MIFGEFNIVTGNETKILIIRFPENPTGFLTCPNPKHLEDPEAEKRPKFISLVVKPIVFARFQYPEQQKPRESGAPCHHEKGDYDLTRIVGARERKRDDR